MFGIHSSLKEGRRSLSALVCLTACCKESLRRFWGTEIQWNTLNVWPMPMFCSWSFSTVVY